MRCALKLQQEFNRQTYIFTGNLKVAGNGLEALYRQTKKAGTVYMKFTETIPDIQADKDGNVTITYVDEIIRETFKYVYGDLTDKQIEYAGNDVKYLCGIFEDQLEALRFNDSVRIAQLEFKLVPVVVDMELTGIKLDQEKWLAATERSLQKASEIELQIQEMIGGGAVQSSFLGTPKSTINPRSSKQMLDAFHSFDRKITSTSESGLKYIDHPLAKLLLDYRKSYKLGSTYGKNFLELVQDDGRIHAEFNQLGAQSGRFSSSKPNLQNIPTRTPLGHRVRNGFVAAEGNLLLSVDYSQIELRIVAHMANDTAMLNVFRAKQDIHATTAAAIYDVPLEDAGWNDQTPCRSTRKSNREWPVSAPGNLHQVVSASLLSFFEQHLQPALNSFSCP